jgi:small subunit ribosomal protein S20
VPNIQSAKKRMRQALRHRARNRQQRSAVRTATKKVRQAANAEEAAAAYRDAEQLLDRAARKHLVHRNNAARHKRRLKKLVAKKGEKK